MPDPDLTTVAGRTAYAQSMGWGQDPPPGEYLGTGSYYGDWNDKWTMWVYLGNGNPPGTYEDYRAGNPNVPMQPPGGGTGVGPPGGYNPTTPNVPGGTTMPGATNPYGGAGYAPFPTGGAPPGGYGGGSTGGGGVSVGTDGISIGGVTVPWEALGTALNLAGLDVPGLEQGGGGDWWKYLLAAGLGAGTIYGMGQMSEAGKKRDEALEGMSEMTEMSEENARKYGGYADAAIPPALAAMLGVVEGGAESMYYQPPSFRIQQSPYNSMFAPTPAPPPFPQAMAFGDYVPTGGGGGEGEPEIEAPPRPIDIGMWNQPPPRSPNTPAQGDWGTRQNPTQNPNQGYYPTPGAGAGASPMYQGPPGGPGTPEYDAWAEAMRQRYGG